MNWFLLQLASNGYVSFPFSAISVYASWNGLLGKHVQKTYNFLELAFKTGREKTLGGFQVNGTNSMDIIQPNA